MAAWSMTRWHNNGQSCIKPNMMFPPDGGPLYVSMVRTNGSAATFAGRAEPEPRPSIAQASHRVGRELRSCGEHPGDCSHCGLVARSYAPNIAHCHSHSIACH